MENSVMIAQVLGLMYLSIGIGMLLSPAHYDKLLSEFENHSSLIYLGGIIALIFGYVILHMNNVWEGSYVGAITLIGWIACVKGVILLAKPDAIIGQMAFWKKQRTLMQVVVIALGAVFAYYGFIA
ncbi:hypothetical protein HOL63_03850 [Candidatus Peregrinibacteria bacterium]|jgi:hypothetical protein|nr:hypothetical protein [Candidatus Peregrinibacteria bacterium]MBT5468954.1 hypothetical protein [Candidatus Peregrinibacteria bacterium]MBT7337642.1 hypothetical protein [Candidatus Peregrinibacteria bacterium]